MKLFVALALVAFVGCALVDARSLVARDAKSTLITKGNDLVKKAEEAITKLEADKKTHEVTIVKSEEAKIKKLIADLEAATEASAITRLEHELTRAEHQLGFELAKISHTHPTLPKIPAKRDTKSDLTTKGNDLVKKVDEAITKLTTEKKTHEVAMLKHEETHLKKLITDLGTATEATAITHIEHELSRLEIRLTHQLEAIAKGTHTAPQIPETPKTPAKRDTKSDLTTKGNDLVKKVDEAITKLTTEKKTHEVAMLKHEETHLKKLITDLGAATEATAITHIEHELSRLEIRLTHQLEAIAKGTHPTPQIPETPKTPAKRATKAELITKGNDLVKKADEAITKLTADKKTHEVTIVKTEEAKIKKLIADLEAATDDAKVKTLEHELSTAEHRLAHELAKVNHTGPAVPPTF